MNLHKELESPGMKDISGNEDGMSKDMKLASVELDHLKDLLGQKTTWTTEESVQLFIRSSESNVP